MPHRFILNDESRPNRYGYRVLNSGVRTDDFLANPIVLYMHERGGDAMPVGRVIKLGVEGTQLWVELEIDTDGGELEQRLDGKIERGYIRAVSMGHNPIRTSEAEEHMLPNQTLATVVETELVEVSIVDVPGHAGALRLMRARGEGGDYETLTPATVLAPVHNQLQMPTMDTTPPKAAGTARLARRLGLSENATTDEMYDAVEKLQLAMKEADADKLLHQYADRYDDAELPMLKKLALTQPSVVQELLSARVAKGGDATDAMPSDTDAEPTKAKAAPVKESLAAALHQLANRKAEGAAEEETDAERFNRLQRDKPEVLRKLMQDDPEEYKRLADAWANA